MSSINVALPLNIMHVETGMIQISLLGTSVLR